MNHKGPENVVNSGTDETASFVIIAAFFRFSVPLGYVLRDMIMDAMLQRRAYSCLTEDREEFFENKLAYKAETVE